MRNACLVLLLCWCPLLAMAQLRTDFLGDLPMAVRGDHARMQAMMDRAVSIIAARLPKTHRVLAEARADYAGLLAIAITRDEVAGNVVCQPVAEMNGWVAGVRDSVSLSLGTRAAEAQRLAMVHMIEHPTDPRWSRPACWSPFVLAGSPD